MQKENKMGVMPIGRLVVSMSVPMMLSMPVQALYNIVDSMWVSRVCEDALTAVSLAFPVQNLMIGVATGTGVGVNALLSRSLGAKDYDRANTVASNGVFLAVISSVIFFFLGVFAVPLFFRTQVAADSPIYVYGVDYLTVCCAFSFGVFGQIMVERLLSMYLWMLIQDVHWFLMCLLFHRYLQFNLMALVLQLHQDLKRVWLVGM